MVGPVSSEECLGVGGMSEASLSERPTSLGLRCAAEQPGLIHSIKLSGKEKSEIFGLALFFNVDIT